MTTAGDASGPPRMPERFFIGGGWAAPSSTATLEVIDPSSEAIYLRVAEAPDRTWRAPSGQPPSALKRSRCTASTCSNSHR